MLALQVPAVVQQQYPPLQLQVTLPVTEQLSLELHVQVSPPAEQLQLRVPKVGLPLLVGQLQFDVNRLDKPELGVPLEQVWVLVTPESV